jgi:glutathione peroxidase
MTLYDFTVKDANGKDVPLSDYKGKVLLVVNTAKGCGFTPQYKGLQDIYETYQSHGLEILDFPCNQFMNQAPGTDAEILSFCQIKYGVTFKTFSKVLVNGRKTHPLYGFLKRNSGRKIIPWNFTKFLIDREGRVVRRFSPKTRPEDLAEHIEALL